VSGKLQAIAALPLKRSPRHPLNKRLYGPQGRSERLGVDRKLYSTKLKGRDNVTDIDVDGK